jgi:cytidylate kinase
MSVITISRGTYSGGKILAECLAEKLGYRCIDRDVIVEKAAASGVSQDVLRDALVKPPTFLERFQHKKYLYLTLIQAALAEEVRPGKAVYHGNAGHLLLKGGIPVLRTRIIAPLDFRLQMCIDRLKLSRSEAMAHIQKMDQDRRKWTQYLYGVDWGDPSLYDIVLNLEYISVEESCDIIAGITKDRCFELTPECRRMLDDFAVASRVRANLALSPATEDLEVEVIAQAGSVRIKGKLSSPQQIKEVEHVVLKIPGVSSLNVDELVPPTPQA